MDFWLIAQVLGGLGLFLFGMKMMSDGLEAMAGDKLRNGLERMTKNRFTAVGVGAGVTAVIQSSSATTVMLVGFVNAGLMTLTQAVFVGMGANIGTTVTAQIIAFNITQIAPVILFVGLLMIMFIKKRAIKKLGEIVFGLGVLFFGMGVMSQALAPLRDYEPFLQMISSFEEPWIGLLTGAGVTAIIQSSSATMGIVQAFAMQGVIGLDTGVYLVLGLNIGTCITAILASLGGTKTAKRMAVALLFFNVIGALLFMVLLQFLPIVDWVKSWTPDDPVRQLANFHTFFNCVMTAIFIGLPWVLIKISYLLVRGEDKKLEGRKLQYLAPPLPDSPIVVVSLATKEARRMMHISGQNFKNAVAAFLKRDEKMAADIYDAEKTVNYLNREITAELTKIAGSELPEGDMNTVTQLLHSLMNIERISDIAENIAELTMFTVDNKIKIGKKAAAEIDVMQKRISESLDCVENLLDDDARNRDVACAERAMEIETEVDKMELKIKKNHVKRLKKGECTAVSSTVFTDIVSLMERVADHSANIASIMLREDL